MRRFVSILVSAKKAVVFQLLFEAALVAWTVLPYSSSDVW